jgi:hypothetical protein
MNVGSQILRSGREPNAEGSRQPYLAAADISIRLWTRAQLQTNAAEVSWKTGSNLVFMISDLVTAAQGIPADDLRSGMSAHFNSSAQALKAAKSIQRSVLEFSRRRPDDCFGAAVVVHRPIELRPFLEGDPGPISPALSLLRQAQPGQILVSQETYGQLRELQGLQFRPLSGDSSITGDNELLWASAEIYANFVTRLREALERHPVQNDADPDGFSTTTLFALPLEGQEVGWIASHRLLVSLSAVAVLALAVLYSLPVLRKRPPAVDSSTSIPAVAPPQAAEPDVPGNNSSGVDEPASPSAKVEPAKAARKPVAPAPKVIQSETKTVELKGVSEYDGFFAKDIPLLLKKAQSDAGEGNYDNSAREYEIVLHLDPNNPAAKAGLSRVKLSLDRK